MESLKKNRGTCVPSLTLAPRVSWSVHPVMNRLVAEHCVMISAMLNLG